MVKLSKSDLAIIAGVIGAADFFYEGALTAPVSRAIKKAISAGAARAFLNPGQVPTTRAFAGAAARQLPRVAGTALAVGRTIALRHPVLTAGAVVYYTYKNREEIADLVEQGYDIVQDANIGQNIDPSRFVPALQSEFSRLITEGPRPSPGRVPPGFLQKPKRRRSSYNTSVSKAMKAIKKSTSYGKKGIISTPKKAFGFVARTVSKLRKGKKVPSKGASGVVKRALPGISKITVRKP